ncbi:MAG: RsbRD N-terminal domain-containing protein [Desulfovibrio sp.]|nr:RsbRD N-terminal domain-containing protein [Desulfovibrio sp.]
MKKNAGAMQSGHTEEELLALLCPCREDLLRRWTEAFHATYPFAASGLLRSRKDRFANPVGFHTDEAAKALLDGLFSRNSDEESLRRAVEDIVRIRAVQDFSPEQAVGVFYAIKELLREKVMDSGRAAHLMPALLLMESRVDAVILLAFGVYARCREKLCMQRVDEFKRRHSQILRLAEKKAARTRN